jgi:hypothetical protein
MTSPKTLMFGLVAVMLLATAVPALADGPGSSGTHGGGASATHPMNETERQQRHDELQGARDAAIDSFKENRTKALDAFHASLDATRDSFLENKTKVIDACRASHPEGGGSDDNETRADHANKTRDNETNETHQPKTNETGSSDSGQCVRDGLKPLIESAHAEIRAAQQDFRDAMRDARESALAQFATHRHEVNAKHGQPDA